MKRITRLAALLCLSAGLAHADNAAPLTGQPLFVKKCALCHATGAGNPGMAGMLHVEAAKLNLTHSTLTAVQIDALLHTGRNKMPSFKSLTDDQIKSLSAYVISLRGTAK